jgi:hypothetical protein
VVSINVEKNEVTIKNGNTVTNLTFKVARSNTTPPPPPQGGLPGMVPKPAVPVPQPTQTSYNNNQGSGRYNVMVAGGSSSATPASTGGYGGVQNTGGTTPAYGGLNPNAANLTGRADGGFRSIPSRIPPRDIRTVQPETDPAVSRLQNFEEIEQARAQNYLKEKLTGRPIAPLPPTPLTPDDAPGLRLPPFPGQNQLPPLPR